MILFYFWMCWFCALWSPGDNLNLLCALPRQEGCRVTCTMSTWGWSCSSTAPWCPALQPGPAAKPQLFCRDCCMAKSRPSSHRSMAKSTNFNYIIWVMNFSLVWPHTFTFVFTALITLQIFHNCHCYFSCFSTVFIGITKKWEENKYWCVFITDSRKSWGWDSGTGQFFYPQNIFAQQRKNKEKCCCLFWWF